MTSSIATLCDDLVAALLAALPLARELDDTDGGEATIAHALYPVDDPDDASEQGPVGYHEPPIYDRYERGGLWIDPDTITTAHQRLALLKVRAPIEALFEALCQTLAERAPVLGRPYQRLSITTWSRHDTLHAQVCLYGSTPGLLSGCSIGELGTNLQKLADALAPLDAPIGLFLFEPDGYPVPGYDAVQAAMVSAMIDGKATTRPTLENSVWAARRARALPSPGDIAKAAHHFAAKGTPPTR